ncbi:hypothetical protein VWV84_08310 [Streptococcus agalactiae]|uniref:hypothetical protein n=1 Tax=Streptococcus agalactiae TaxID=1311 RepID=UPI0002E2D377|nr:hypothetical protein [Streptococcus agalactiae]EPW72004.1 hypothetical protein SAG0101_02570 [Streptococcus agalactiae BSU451]QBX23514.1 hypothetical protein Javan14_0012 [Streptococcus phage Javan14]
MELTITQCLILLPFILFLLYLVLTTDSSFEIDIEEPVEEVELNPYYGAVIQNQGKHY